MATFVEFFVAAQELDLWVGGLELVDEADQGALHRVGEGVVGPVDQHAFVLTVQIRQQYDTYFAGVGARYVSTFYAYWAARIDATGEADSVVVADIRAYLFAHMQVLDRRHGFVTGIARVMDHDAVVDLGEGFCVFVVGTLGVIGDRRFGAPGRAGVNLEG